MLHDDVADVDADPKLDRIGIRATGIVLAKLSLDFDGAGHGVNGAGEFHQGTVAHELDDPAGMGGNRRIDQLTPQGTEPGQRSGLVYAHEARISRHVGRQDCRKPPLQALFGHAEHSFQKSLNVGSLWLTAERVYRGYNV